MVPALGAACDNLSPKVSGISSHDPGSGPIVIGHFASMSALFAGIGGGLFAHELGTTLSPRELGFQKSIDIVIMVVLGGMGSISGVILAAAILTVTISASTERIDNQFRFRTASAQQCRIAGSGSGSGIGIVQHLAGCACPRPGPHSILPAMKLLATAVLVLAACGSSPQSTTTPTPTPTPPPQEGATVALPDVPFADLDHDQRIAFMKQKVMPAMIPVFQNHDAKDYAKFSCVVCHGEQAKQGHFDMPNPKLPKLDFNDLSEFHKEDLEWMGKEVMPTMAKVLNLPLFSKDNPKGFGCLACHQMKGKDDKNDHEHDHGRVHDK